MRDDENKALRKVGWRDIASTFVVVTALLVVIWFREAGEAWASIVIALIPIAGLIYWLNLPTADRERAAIDTEEAFKKNRAARIFRWFVRIVVGITLLMIGWSVINELFVT